MKTKKLKIIKNLELFDLLGEWQIDDDQLVDLLHTKFFNHSIEQGQSYQQILIT